MSGFNSPAIVLHSREWFNSPAIVLRSREWVQFQIVKYFYPMHRGSFIPLTPVVKIIFLETLQIYAMQRSKKVAIVLSYKFIELNIYRFNYSIMA